MLEQQKLVAELLRVISEADGSLTNEQLIDTDPVLFKKARATFGSWEDALVAALCFAAQGKRRKTSRTTLAAEVSHRREQMEGWDAPAVLHLHGGELTKVVASRWGASAQVPGEFALDRDDKDESLWVRGVLPNPREEGFVAFSKEGTAFFVDGAVIPHQSLARRKAPDVMGLASGEEPAAWLLRRALHSAERFVHLSAGGKIKASDARDLYRNLPREGTQALLLAPGDEIVGVFGQKAEARTFFCASKEGNGIHFKLDAVRTMGLRAQGVKAMEVEGNGIVGGDMVLGGEQILVISRKGVGKRVSMEEFRIQGRGGQGMILMRPHLSGDEIAGVALIRDLNEDILLWDDRGKVLRMPATSFPLLGRSQKGTKVVNVDDSGGIAGLCRLPGSGS